MNPRRSEGVIALVRAGHAVPAVAVTVFTGLLAVADGADIWTLIAIVIAIFSGQLVIGWSNDFLDRSRDRQVGRPDKPLTTGELTSRTVVVAIVAAAGICVVSSFACGWSAGTVHLLLGVGSGLAYNAYFKATVLSWLPYSVAFGSLPVIASLAVHPGELPPAWMVAVAALLGVGAHLLNALPDLDDDAATGIDGLPHRLGARRVPLVAAALMVAATAILVVANSSTWWLWVELAVVAVLSAVTMRLPGRAAFYGAIVVAAINVAMLLTI